MKFTILKILFILLTIFFNSNSYANDTYFEDWSGIYYLKTIYNDGKVKHPDFRHFSEDTHHILISTWKGKLIFQARIKTMKPLRYGYFDSEIKYPNMKRQTLIEDKCKVEIELNKDNLKVDMKSIQDCRSAINISGEYVKHASNLNYKNNQSDNIPKGELFLGKFYNEQICDKATSFKSDSKYLTWTDDKDLKEFVNEAKRRNLTCNVKIGYVPFVLGCLIAYPTLPQNCEEMEDIRGPYSTLKRCKIRLDEILNDMPKYRPYMEARAFRCTQI